MLSYLKYGNQWIIRGGKLMIYFKAVLLQTRAFVLYYGCALQFYNPITLKKSRWNTTGLLISD